jgi:glycosyltransferase involved in cell wall biosynthesis
MLIPHNSQEKAGEPAGARYVVISPVKNEAQYIGLTIDSMIHQNIRPLAWVIVNDGSQDDTEAIVSKYARQFAWIHLVNRTGSATRKRGRGVVEAFYAGFETVAENWEFVVKLDGDVSFDPDYFESLLREFAADPLLGIAGGALYEKPYGETWVLNTVEDHVRGATKVYRRACFDAIGGLTPSMGWDGIDEWKALSMGWKVHSFLNLKFMHYRFTGAATGYLKSFYEQGYGAYRMGYHPLYITARGLRRMGDRPYVTGGLAMIWAYLVAWLRREEMLAGPDVVRYIRRTQLKKLGGLLRGRPVYE